MRRFKNIEHKRVTTMGFNSINIKQALVLVVLLMASINTASANQKILVWGDSLSAAYGIPVDRGWVNLMRNKLGDKIDITNGSISGETTQGGLTRLPRALKKVKPDFIILELGANDGLRGISPAVTKSNLNNMIKLAQKANVKVMLLGMKIPPNYGVAYSQKFEQVFKDLAKQYALPFIPFFLEKVIVNLTLLQEDELHPTAEAQPIILLSVYPVVRELLKN
jgi:acyl-CoA thioesterase-1